MLARRPRLVVEAASDEGAFLALGQPPRLLLAAVLVLVAAALALFIPDILDTSEEPTPDSGQAATAAAVEEPRRPASAPGASQTSPRPAERPSTARGPSNPAIETPVIIDMPIRCIASCTLGYLLPPRG